MCNILHLLDLARVQVAAHVTVNGSNIYVSDASSAMMILSRKKTRHVLRFAQLQSVVTVSQSCHYVYFRVPDLFVTCLLRGNKQFYGVDVARSLQGCDALMTGAATYCDNFIYSYYPMIFLCLSFFGDKLSM